MPTFDVVFQVDLQEVRSSVDHTNIRLDDGGIAVESASDHRVEAAVDNVQGDQLRVQGKKRDELQAVIVQLKGLDSRLPLQYVNYRD